MKTQKRDNNHRAHCRGYLAGLNGKSKELCPHHAGENRHSWLGGWREGRCDNWDGLGEVSALHKLIH